MLTVAILAAGKGTRMASALPKVLHKLSGKTLLQRVIDSCKKIKPDKIYIIVGYKSTSSTGSSTLPFSLLIPGPENISGTLVA